MPGPEDQLPDAEAASDRPTDDTPFPEFADVPVVRRANPGTGDVFEAQAEETERSVAPEATPPASGEPEESSKSSSPGFATATLGRLYLRQGHYAEAEEIFREVLKTQPDHEVARRAIRRIGLRTGWSLAATDLVPGSRPGSAEGDEAAMGTESTAVFQARVKLLLEGYRGRLRRAAEV